MRRVGVLCCAVALTAVPAMAGTFIGNSSGVFGTPTGPVGDPIVYSGVGTNEIHTGTGMPDDNYLNFGGTAFDVDAESQFAVGRLTYHNGITALGSNASELPISIMLVFSAPSGLPDQSFGFDFNLLVTPNNTGTSPADDDILSFPAAFPDHNFAVDGQSYTLKLLGFSTDGGTTILDHFQLPEQQTVESYLYATITTETNPNLVPVPAAFWAGLGTLPLLVIMKLRRTRASQVV